MQSPFPDHGRIRVIGDVHGAVDAFAAAVEEGLADGRFILQLGDIVDNGPDAPGCMRLMLELVGSGRGTFLLGNHEDKLCRWHQGRNVTIDPVGLGQTIAQLDGAADGAALLDRFTSACAVAPLWVQRGRHFFVHGAFHPAMLDLVSSDEAETKRLAGKVRARALYGQPDGSVDAAGKPVRLYDWVDTVPMGWTVVVGHDIRSIGAPLKVVGALGSTVVFLDTGSGKGGRLSWLDLTLA